MAKKDLNALAEKLNKKMFESSEAYRTLVSDFEAHIVHIDVNKIKSEVRAELNHRSGRDLKLPESIEKIIEEYVPQVAASLYTSFNPANFNTDRKKYNTAELEGSPTNFKFKLSTKPGQKGNVFKYFRRAKQKAQKPFVIALDQQIAKINSGRSESSRIARLREKNKRGNLQIVAFLDIGHMDDTSVSMQRQSAVNAALWDWSQNVGADAKRFIAEQSAKYNIAIFKEGDPRPGVIAESNVFLEGKGGNRGKQVDQELQKFLNSIVAEENWSEQEGSDSPIRVVEKRVNNMFVGIGGKKAKSNIKKEKVNNPSSVGRSKAKKSKGKAQKPYRGEKVVVGGRGGNTQQTGGPALDLRTLIGPLNAKLTETVEKNMGAPSLENRTGRFASSVKVTDIVKTPKGYPSIGYTYMKSPYQTFEVGGKQGSVEQDPRTLIDRSIRDIAIDFALGRFYTRRV